MAPGHGLVSAGRGSGSLTRVRDLPTGGKAETFAVRRYTLTGSGGYMDAGHSTGKTAGGVSPPSIP